MSGVELQVSKRIFFISFLWLLALVPVLAKGCLRQRCLYNKMTLNRDLAPNQTAYGSQASHARRSNAGNDQPFAHDGSISSSPPACCRARAPRLSHAPRDAAPAPHRRQRRAHFPPAVPLPPTAILFATGLGAMGLLWQAEEAEERRCCRNRLIETPDRISDRPPARWSSAHLEDVGPRSSSGIQAHRRPPQRRRISGLAPVRGSSSPRRARRRRP
jgi:hypothetical protein